MRRFASTVLVMVLLVVGAGCGQTGQQQTEASGELVFGLPALPTTLIPASDPSLVQTVSVHYAGTLLSYAPQPEGGETISSPDQNEPGLATSYEVTPEGLVFTLRQAEDGDGDVLEAEDVRYTFERMVATEDSIGTFVMTTAGMDMDDPVTVIEPDTVRLNGDITPIGLLAAVFPYMSILNKDVVEQHATEDDPWAEEWLTTNTAGFGPYSVTTFEPGKQMILEANENYWNGPPAYSQVTVAASGEQSVAQLLRSGSIDWSSSTPVSDYADLAEDPGLHSTLSVTTVQNLLQLNSSFPAFQDADVRRAISMAVDREQLAADLYHGAATPATSVVSAAVPGVGELDSPYFAHDPEKARELLESTPYADGFEFTLAVNPQALKRVSASTLGVALRSMLEPLDITVNIREVENSAEFLAGAGEGKYDAFINSEGPAVADAAYAMSLAHTSSSVLNYTGFSTDEIDGAISEALEMPLGEERQRTALSALEAWNEEMFGIPLVDESDPYVASTDVCGFATYPYMAVGAAALQPC